MADDTTIAISGRREYADCFAKRHLGQRLLGTHAEWLFALGCIDVGKSDLLLLTVDDHGHVVLKEGPALGDHQHLQLPGGGQDLLALKWRNYKIHFQVRMPSTGPVVQAGQSVVTATHERLAIPYVFDVENDPKELWNINAANNWLSPILAPILRAYGISTKKFPNLAPGAAGP